jgi:hypothetical protein
MAFLGIGMNGGQPPAGFSHYDVGDFVEDVTYPMGDYGNAADQRRGHGGRGRRVPHRPQAVRVPGHGRGGEGVNPVSAKQSGMVWGVLIALALMWAYNRYSARV